MCVCVLCICCVGGWLNAAPRRHGAAGWRPVDESRSEWGRCVVLAVWEQGRVFVFVFAVQQNKNTR